MFAAPCLFRSKRDPDAANWVRNPLQIGLTSGAEPDATAVVIFSKFPPKLTLVRWILMLGLAFSKASIIRTVAVSSWTRCPSQNCSTTRCVCAKQLAIIVPLNTRLAVKCLIMLIPSSVASSPLSAGLIVVQVALAETCRLRLRASEAAAEVLLPTVERGVILVHGRVIHRAVDRHVECLVMRAARLHVGNENRLGVTGHFLSDLKRHNDEAVVVTADDIARTNLGSTQSDRGLSLDSFDPAGNDGAAAALGADGSFLLQDLRRIPALPVRDDSNGSCLHGPQGVLRTPEADVVGSANVRDNHVARLDVII